MFNDWSYLEEKRVIRAKDLKLINVNDDFTYAECVGSASESYKIHAQRCSCPDYAKKGFICKHMIALAAMRGDIDLDALIREIELNHKIEDVRQKLSIAYADYYLFKSPSVKDSEYDKMKKEYNELTELKMNGEQK